MKTVYSSILVAVAFLGFVTATPASAGNSVSVADTYGEQMREIHYRCTGQASVIYSMFEHEEMQNRLNMMSRSDDVYQHPDKTVRLQDYSNCISGFLTTAQDNFSIFVDTGCQALLEDFGSHIEQLGNIIPYYGVSHDISNEQYKERTSAAFSNLASGLSKLAATARFQCGS